LPSGSNAGPGSPQRRPIVILSAGLVLFLVLLHLVGSTLQTVEELSPSVEYGKAVTFRDVAEGLRMISIADIAQRVSIGTLLYYLACGWAVYGSRLTRGPRAIRWASIVLWIFLALESLGWTMIPGHWIGWWMRFLLVDHSVDGEILGENWLTLAAYDVFLVFSILSLAWGVLGRFMVRFSTLGPSDAAHQ